MSQTALITRFSWRSAALMLERPIFPVPIKAALILSFAPRSLPVNRFAVSAAAPADLKRSRRWRVIAGIVCQPETNPARWRLWSQGIVMLRLSSFLCAASCVLAQWPQWGGPNRDFKVDSPPLADTWPTDGPRKLWTRPLGEGFSGIVLSDGRLFTMYN